MEWSGVVLTGSFTSHKITRCWWSQDKMVGGVKTRWLVESRQDDDSTRRKPGAQRYKYFVISEVSINKPDAK